MTAMATRRMVGGHGPEAAAELAAEAVRTVNHLTLVAPPPGVPDWEDVADLYRGLVNCVCWSNDCPRRSARSPDISNVSPVMGTGAMVGPPRRPAWWSLATSRALGTARHAMRHSAVKLPVARSAVAHLAPRVAAH